MSKKSACCDVADIFMVWQQARDRCACKREAPMKLTRRNFSKLAGSGVLAIAAPGIFAPALAQDKPLRIGIIAPRSGAAGTAAPCGIRAGQWAAARMNEDGGIPSRTIG